MSRGRARFHGGENLSCQIEGSGSVKKKCIVFLSLRALRSASASTSATANSQNKTQDPSTPVSCSGENAREPSCAQDDRRLPGTPTADVLTQGSASRQSQTAKIKRRHLRLRSGWHAIDGALAQVDAGSFVDLLPKATTKTSITGPHPS